MDINDIKHLAVERIYLVPDASEGQLGYAWCDDPAPGVDMDPSEAVEYVRRDVHEARIAELERIVTQFKAATIKASTNGFGQDDVHHDDSWIDDLDAALKKIQLHDAKRLKEMRDD